MKKKQILVCGTGFGKIYLKAIAESKEYELMGILGKGSDRSRLLSKNLNVPMYTDIKEINQNVDAACVVVPNAAGGGNGANPLHLYHRIELTFSTGRLCLVNTHGPVIWLPFLHMPRDEYGTLSINVEEEVNIPSGVTIGNVMLPSVKETFEQIWPDAVKKALEILFKQNRTEKMSMAQYQIYVSKLWSEICQKVGYMNIVDYDNFGDIKSIFYDLEKRHLIKKENDGIE